MGVSTGIQVNLAALTGVLTDLRRDVDQGLTPSTHGAARDLGDAAKFGGRSASGEVVAGATDITYAASIAASNIGIHVHNALGLASIIEAAVMSYRLVDTVSSNAFAKFEPAVETSDGPSPSTLSAETSGLTPAFVGPLPSVTLPNQVLTSAQFCTNWDAYDTPRLWSMVKGEVSDAAWAQMHGFRKLGDALDEEHRRLIVLRDRLSTAWRSPEASEAMLRVWDQHTTAVASDSMCVQITSIALDCILNVLAETRNKMQRQHASWVRITSDFMPEAWDHKAREIDKQSREIMADAESAIKDYRQMIKVPDQARSLAVENLDWESSEPINASEGRSTGSGRASGENKADIAARAQAGAVSSAYRHRSVPPVLPGMQPTTSEPGLSGSPVTVPMSPTNPPSILPIPPGVLPDAPGGGAYIVPGPWSGSGRIVPLPGTAGPAGNPARTTAASSGQTGTGMYGIPSGGLGHQDTSYGSRQRMRTERWEVATGGPSVIGTSIPWYKTDEEDQADDAVDRLEQWIKIVGTPWDLEAKSERAK